MTTCNEHSDGITITTVLRPTVAAKLNIQALIKLLDDIASNQPLTTILADVLTVVAGNIIPPIT